MQTATAPQQTANEKALNFVPRQFIKEAIKCNHEGEMKEHVS